MKRELFRDRSVLIALGVLVLALITVAWTASRAIRIEPAVAAAPPSFATDAALRRAGMVVPPDIGAVVAQNVFSPDRTAPARRYRLSGYGDEAPVVEPPKPLVLGTAVFPDKRSFAICRLPDGGATVLYVGGTIGIYTVKSIGRNVVTFTSASGEPLVVTASRQ